MWCLNLNAFMLSKVGYDANNKSIDLTQPGYLSKVSPTKSYSLTGSKAFSDCLCIQYVNRQSASCCDGYL